MIMHLISPWIWRPRRRPNFREILCVPHHPLFSCQYLVLGKFQAKPPPTTPLLSIHSLIFYCIYLLLLSFFACLISYLPPKYGSDPASDEDVIIVEAVVTGGPYIPTIPVITTWFYLLNDSRNPTKLLFIFNQPESPVRSVVPPVTKILEQRHASRVLVITCQEFPRPPPSFHTILNIILHPKEVESDAQTDLQSSSAATIVIV